MSDLKQLAAEGETHLKNAKALAAKARSAGNEDAIALSETLVESVVAIQGLMEMIANRDAMLAEMSGALSQLMMSADEPQDKIRAVYFKEGMSRARAIQEMYSRKLGNG
tara:strand:- start:66 stop:392 length:327 start_codon:yes stop_codon:yes gene_type:complete